MKICAGIVEYGDPEGLDRCLSTLGLGEGGLDGAIVIHRKFDHFDLEDKIDYLQETLRVARKYPNVYVDHSDERITQVDARNIYLELAGKQGYDWLLVIDSDEFLLKNADWQLFRRQLEFVDSLGLDDQIFDVGYEGSIAERNPKPRLFKDPSTITYWVKHYWFVVRKKKQLYQGISDAGRIISGIIMMHSKAIRTREHLEATLRYYDHQIILEQPTIEQVPQMPFKQIIPTVFEDNKWIEQHQMHINQHKDKQDS